MYKNCKNLREKVQTLLFSKQMIQIYSIGARGKSQWLTALPVLVENLGVVSSTHIIAYNCLQL